MHLVPGHSGWRVMPSIIHIEILGSMVIIKALGLWLNFKLQTRIVTTNVGILQGLRMELGVRMIHVNLIGPFNIFHAGIHGL